MKTRPMSTYMVAFIVSGFDVFVTGGFDYESSMYVFTRADNLDQIQYVLDEAPQLLMAMEDFTEMWFYMPKFDMFAVPDLKSHAMGNWGLIILR